MPNSFSIARANVAKLGLLAVLFWPIAATLHGDVGQNTENRRMAPAPSLPASWQQFLAMPAQADAWINDHFGMRSDLVDMNNWLRFKLFREFPSVQFVAGRHGRMFLAAHATDQPPYSAMTHVCAGDAVASPGTVSYFNLMFADFDRMGMHPRVLIVPSAPVVESGDVPRWLEQRCAGNNTAPAKVLADPELTPAARQNIFYPLQEMRALGSNENLFPKTWFHWSGPGLADVAKLSVAHFWGLPAQASAPLPTRSQWENSDIGYLAPGVPLVSLVVKPDLEAAHIKACYGGDCFPEFTAYRQYLNDTSRFTNAAAPDRRLLIISDSFGSKVSGWYTRYYRTVEQIATNAIDQLSDAQIESLKQVLLRDPQHTDILFLYHDGGAVYNSLKSGIQRLHKIPRVAGVTAVSPGPT
jgi:hypothetical protein